jgi:hypothetical protein
VQTTVRLRPEKPAEIKPVESPPATLGAPLAKRNLTTSGLGQLTPEAAEADDRMEDHLRHAFGSQLATLESTEGTAATPPAPSQSVSLPPPAAAGLAAFFSSSDNLRNAVILSEIFNRPEDRWE